MQAPINEWWFEPDPLFGTLTIRHRYGNFGRGITITQYALNDRGTDFIKYAIDKLHTELKDKPQ